MRKFLVVLVMLGITGCSNKEVYDTFRFDERFNCANQPPTTYNECIERTNKSYEEYERERKEVVEKNKPMDTSESSEKRMKNHNE